MSYYESPSDLYGKSFGFGSPEPSLPRLRKDLVIRQQTQEQEVFFVIKDPETQAYYRFSPLEWDILSLFDGGHSYEEIAQKFNVIHPQEMIDEETVESYRKSLHEMELLEMPAAQKSLILMERIRSMRKKRAEGEGNLFYITFSAWDPDRIFDRIVPYFRFLWTMEFFVASLTCVLLMVAVDAVKWNEFKHGMFSLYTFSEKSLWDFLVFVFLMTATGMLHEIGHGMTLKHYGGEVHKVGFLLFYLTPAFYCDVSDSYLLQSRKERLWVTFAGSYIELCFCSLATFVWFFAVPGTLLYDFSFKVLLFTGVSSFLLNMNPLIKLDGYYALMDWLGIPDLREQSFDYLGRWIKKNVFRLQVEPMEELTGRKRRIFLTYGFFAILYTLSVYYLLLSWIRNIYLRTFPQFAYLLLLFTIYYFFRKEFHEAAGFANFLFLDKKEILKKKKTLVWGGAGAAFLLLLLLVPKTSMKISSPFVIEPAERAEVRCESEGLFQEVFVKENDTVRAGQTLAAMSNPELLQKLQRVTSGLELLDRELSVLQSSGDLTEYQMKVRTRQSMEQQKVDLERKAAALTLKAPLNGTITTPHVEESVGSYAVKGGLFCEVDDLGKVKIQMPVPDYLIDDVHPGQDVVLKTEAYPTDTFRGRVAMVSSAAGEEIQAFEGRTTRFLVTVIIDNRGKRLLPGMQGDAKILAQKYSISGRITRELWRWVKSKVW